MQTNAALETENAALRTALRRIRTQADAGTLTIEQAADIAEFALAGREMPAFGQGSDSA